MGSAESIKWGVKTPAIVRGRVRDDVERQWYEKPPLRSKTTTQQQPTSQKPPGGSLEQVPSLGVF